MFLSYAYFVISIQISLVLISEKRIGAVTEKISDQSTGDVAIDFYHKYKVNPNANDLLSLVSWSLE